MTLAMDRRTIVLSLGVSVLAVVGALVATSWKQGVSLPVTLPEVPVVADHIGDLTNMGEDVTAALTAQLFNQQLEILTLKEDVRRLREQAAAHVAVAAKHEQEADLLTLQPVTPVEPIMTHAQAERVKHDALRTLGPLGLTRVIIGSR